MELENSILSEVIQTHTYRQLTHLFLYLWIIDLSLFISFCRRQENGEGSQKQRREGAPQKGIVRHRYNRERNVETVACALTGAREGLGNTEGVEEEGNNTNQNKLIKKQHYLCT